ncbi:hypothetical protein CPSG_03161 [Coccidioides posadasii str. Silveira]|uniref:Uncharacterized protein n=2 Tax=Coccidioides posadasii TaxID=199306 RepID=E9D0Y2_COCPS|nr:hypothetical protein CPSG_03161 [Coccidioides posadasii str. Silveira]KMM73444.1 hypothetical protein CPAG_09733 [Coccidioides posadasii RMSCC 3488]
MEIAMCLTTAPLHTQKSVRLSTATTAPMRSEIDPRYPELSCKQPFSSSNHGHPRARTLAIVKDRADGDGILDGDVSFKGDAISPASRRPHRPAGRQTRQTDPTNGAELALPVSMAANQSNISG